MGYEKPYTKLIFYKAFFSAQWKFLIHTILQCMSAKRTTWNEFSSSMASTLFQVLYVSKITKIDDTYSSWKVEALEQDKFAQAIEILKVKQRVEKLEKKNKVKTFRGKIAKIDADKDVILEEVVAEVPKDADVQGRQEETQAQVYHIDLEHADKVLSIQDDEPEPVELKEVIKVVTTVKLMTEVDTIAATTAASTITAAPSAARKRKGVVIRDLKILLLHQP
nr:hypothetical protein [Tanacetum cinerariifolium]